MYLGGSDVDALGVASVRARLCEHADDGKLEEDGFAASCWCWVRDITESNGELSREELDVPLMTYDVVSACYTM